MPRLIAFLRAINVGGHTVKMDYLRQLFESMGFAGVETFIASGNVIFTPQAEDDPKVLERPIESGLRQALGYDVATFIRTEEELAAIAAYSPFEPAAVEAATAYNVAFLKDKLDEDRRQKLMALRTEIDNFHAHNREVYWLCQTRQSDSTFSNAVLEKSLGSRSTLRGVKTVRQIAEKYNLSAG